MNHNTDISNTNVSTSPSIVVNPGFISEIQVPLTNYIYYEDGGNILVDAENITSNSYIVFNKFDETVGFNFGRMADSRYHVGSTRKEKSTRIRSKILILI